MTDFAVSIESLVKDSENLTFQAAAMESITTLGLQRNEVRGIDRALTRIGLESATSLAAEISVEGVIDWVKNKISALGRKVSLVVNKIYAKITGADDKVKALLKRAEKDPSVELPISGKKIALVSAACAAVLGAVGYYIKRAQGAGKDVSGNTAMPDEGPVKKARESLQRLFKQTKEDKVNREYQRERRKAVKQKMKARADRRNALAESTGDDRLRVDNNKSKSYLKMISGFFKSLWSMISGFGKRVQLEAGHLDGDVRRFNDPNSEPREAKKGIWNKVKVFGQCIAGIFKIIGNWFGVVKPKDLSGGSAPADLSTARSASAARNERFASTKEQNALREQLQKAKAEKAKRDKAAKNKVS